MNVHARGPVGLIAALPSRLWAFGLGAFVLLAIAAIIYGPDILFAISGGTEGLAPAERITATTALRQVVLFSLGGLLAVITLYLAQRRDAVARAKHDIDRDAHWTSRYNDAVTQLGDTDHLAVRLGGIYALQRLAAESAALGDRDDTAAVRSLLAAFIRFSSFTRPDDDSAAPEDIRAAARVLGGTGPEGQEPVDLRRAWLDTADLTGAALPGANFTGAFLLGAKFDSSDLTGAQFQDAHLSRATS